MFRALPLKADFEENETVYSSIFLLYSTNNQIVCRLVHYKGDLKLTFVLNSASWPVKVLFR